MFKSTSDVEFTASNGNTVRFSRDASGAVRVNARKGTHNQSVSVLSASDIAALAAWLADGGADNV